MGSVRRRTDGPGVGDSNISATPPLLTDVIAGPNGGELVGDMSSSPSAPAVDEGAEGSLWTGTVFGSAVAMPLACLAFFVLFDWEDFAGADNEVPALTPDS